MATRRRKGAGFLSRHLPAMGGWAVSRRTHGHSARGTRRGVLLLVILALLVMFGLVAVAFVVVTGHAMRSAQAIQRISKFETRPRETLHQALLQAVRGSNNWASVMGPHSLLEDIYGSGTVEGQVDVWYPAPYPEPILGAILLVTKPTFFLLASDPTFVLGGQLFEFTVPRTEDNPHQYVGRVLTITSGSCAGASVRIVGVRQAGLPPGVTLPDGGSLLYWDLPATKTRPIWRFQAVAEGRLPMGPDGRPGRADFDDDQSGVPDNIEELSWPLPNPPWGVTDDLKPGDSFVINGAPFSGTGLGFNQYSGKLDARYAEPAGPPLALLPRPFLTLAEYQLWLTRVWQPGPDLAPGTADDRPDPPPILANEDYDAVEFQNMLLGAQIVSTTGQAITIPSLHRPALVNYWFHQLYANLAPFAGGIPWPTNDEEVRWRTILQPYGPDYLPGTGDEALQPFNLAIANAILDLKRRIILRPLPEDHRGFDGSNPSSRLLNLPAFNAGASQVNPYWDRGDWGTWDVDNDGDGVPDGIWVDLGMPVRSAPDGRLYKPLFSFLCLDLDGRLNVNAHGCLAQSDSRYYSSIDLRLPDETGERPYFAPPVGGPFLFAGETPALSLPRGQGYGPAEVNLLPLFSNVGAYNAFLTRRYQPLPTAVPNPDPLNLPGSAWPDPLSYNKWFEYGGGYWTFLPNGAGAYGTPPNPLGCGAIALDLAGRPVYCRMGGNDPVNKNDEKIDNPYKLNLSDRSPVDSPFTVAELERLLRAFDREAGVLPGGLFQLTKPSPTDPSFMRVFEERRHAITTESWDLPCPSLALPKTLRDALPGKRAQDVRDLLGAMLRKKSVDPALFPAFMRQLLPPEMLAGQKMHLNRPFGNGRDDDNNGVVDEPFEAFYPTNPESLTLYSQPGISAPFAFSYDTDGNLSNSLKARQLHARHLYVLLMLLADTRYLETRLGNLEAVARFLAQWAINVVDFYDRDSIMTPFEYDTEPFVDSNNDGNPWDVDDDLTTADGIATPHVVWGCERPELLITETLAIHDRRTQDLSTDSSGKKTTDDPNGSPPDNDDDFDQRWKPQGSLFIELFNPWTTLEAKSADLYNSPAGGVDLTKASGGSPVWRLIIVDREQAAKNPDDPTDPPTIERAVYFVPSTVALPAGGNVKFRPDDTTYAAKIAPVMPGRYVVIGPGQPSDTGTSTTYMGFQTGSDPSNPGNSRRIELTPNTDPQTNQVAVVSTGGTTAGANDLDRVTIQSATAVVINSPRRLSISEPEDGYDDYTGTGEYNPPLDPPQDATKNPELWNGGYVKLKDNDTYVKAKVVHLQRLADPLLPYDRFSNPYRTIDASAIDLTSFNGVTDAKDNGPRTSVDEQDNGIEFYTRQRGQSNDATFANNLWTRVPYDQAPKPNEGDPADNLPADATDHYFGNALHHTLGYLNWGFSAYTDPGPPPRTLHKPRDATSGTAYVGDPRGAPFPWLTWNNRPFVSHLELLLVPLTSSQQLLADPSEFTDPAVGRRFGMATAGANPYSTPLQPFAHLPDFFHSDDSGADPPNSPQLHRLLEYVEVPSRFAGAELQGNPTLFAAPGAHSFHPPFNLISRYREPGRINLNTIFSEDVWTGLMDFFPDMATAGWRWSEFVASRRGYAGTNIWDFDTHGAYPTRFAQPFRSFAGGEMVPLDGLRPQREIDATLLRSQTLLDSTTPSNQPLFEYNPATQQPYNNTIRNPYFRYQGLQRLGNLVTTRSNVYAIWITVGYFEVEPVPSPDFRRYNPGGAEWTAAQYQAVYPDGYALGPELGIETGEVQRHRAFYIFDRSIPVGFRRGQDLNVEKAVLLGRFIE